MKTPHQHRVERFMMKANQEVPRYPVIPNRETRRLRANLILEEAAETVRALGFQCVTKIFSKEVEPNLVEIVDGCADISVVTIGTLSACGVSDQPILEAVDANNLAKFGPGSCRRESDGKWIKPPGHKPPDIMALLREQAAQ